MVRKARVVDGVADFVADKLKLSVRFKLLLLVMMRRLVEPIATVVVVAVVPPLARNREPP